MATFLGNDYLLTSPAARSLYAGIADLPIIDPHNHADVREICENRHYQDLWQVQGATDHYVWELLRKRGVPERLITGDATNEEKWLAAAAVFEELAGNPTYEWVHLDLRRLLGISELINRETAAAIWQRSRELFQQPDFRPQALLRRMRVERMCSTDDPVDTLEYHQRLGQSPIAGVVRPTYRPDRAMNLLKPGWRDYLRRLETRTNITFRHLDDLTAALRITHDFFAANGCVASDHGVETPWALEVDPADAEAVFAKALRGKPVGEAEAVCYMSWFMHQCAALDAEKGWVFQLHLGAVRDQRQALLQSLGADSGGDVSDHAVAVLRPLVALLNRFDDRLKVVLYCLSPVHQSTLATLTRAFGAKVNLGSGWWFNDTPVGMREQLEYVAGVDLLSSHAGMVSDSRKLLSYGSRHEMFRRCLAEVVGRMVEQGRVPMAVAERLVTRVAYHNPKQLYGL